VPSVIGFLFGPYLGHDSYDTVVVDVAVVAIVMEAAEAARGVVIIEVLAHRREGGLVLRARVSVLWRDYPVRAFTLFEEPHSHRLQ
jgi:hypothetical protein